MIEETLPFAGYDRLKAREILDGFSHRSQVELEAVERYERDHDNRKPVLDKLRYMRGAEPLTGYDALSVDEIVAALDGADMRAITRVRDYERKFANRPTVLEHAARARKRRQATDPVTAAPGYQPMSAK